MVCRVRGPEPSPGRADVRLPRRAGDVGHAQLRQGGRCRRLGAGEAAAAAAEEAVLEAASVVLARPVAARRCSAVRRTAYELVPGNVDRRHISWHPAAVMLLPVIAPRVHGNDPCDQTSPTMHVYT